MTNQTIQTPRISEEPENFRAVFESARSTCEGVRAGTLEAAEASAMARNDTVAQRVLDSDLKARIVDHRLRAKEIAAREAPQITRAA